ncbi:MAG: hypothetical protein M1819_003272 [Sarea resinae]|nr:MAG: hypothetical protein M1819_003272 [Sarea resinae]
MDKEREIELPNSAKRRKLDVQEDSKLGFRDEMLLESLSRSITPPLRGTCPQKGVVPGQLGSGQAIEQSIQQHFEQIEAPVLHGPKIRLVPSPIQLTRIRDLPPSSNVDTISLSDIIGDPLIKECWQFNYLYDVDFLMDAFDEDVRGLVQVKIVHGAWKKEDSLRIYLEDACRRFPNVKPVTAYMPEPFGTHHTKMMVLLRHDGYAQIVIHTANMIPKDWTNMTQAVWRSPLLPLLPDKELEYGQPLVNQTKPPFGSGERFKQDLLSYLRAYGQSKTGSLTKEIVRFDFSEIKAAIVGSIPCRQDAREARAEGKTLWGWPGLREVLSSIPTKDTLQNERSQIVTQVSSIATLGQTSSWLTNALFSALAPATGSIKDTASPQHHIIFPTAHEIRESLDGYSSGTSIHTKIQTAAQAKQVAYLRPLLRHWTSSSSSSHSPSDNTTEVHRREAHRSLAAPHIKTYVRFTSPSMTQIDWALVTSANLSTQAWGAAPPAYGGHEVRICSWEIGVVVWPALFAEDKSDGVGSMEQEMEMVPVFGRDLPDRSHAESETKPETDSEAEGKGVGNTTAADATIAAQPIRRAKTVVGFRMPYSLPLTPYSATEDPWCATASYSEPDRHGRVYNGGWK